LRKKRAAKEKEIYANLTPWQRVLIARHPQRPYTKDYIEALMTDFIELHGDRAFADDKALIGGLARLDGIKVVVMGHQKGRDIKENLSRNFGCAHPEGYRKALRLMQMAEKFNIPIIILLIHPGPILASGQRNAARPRPLR